MLPVHVYDDGRGVLAPLTDLRPAFDVRTGALSNLERLRLSWGLQKLPLHVPPILADLTRESHAGVSVNEPQSAAPLLAVNGRWTGPFDNAVRLLAVGSVLLERGSGEPLAAAIPGKDLARVMAGDLTGLRGVEHSSPERQVLTRPWHVRSFRDRAIRTDLKLLNSTRAFDAPFPGVHVDSTARLNPTALLDAEHGAIVIDSEAVVRPGAILIGPCYIGPHSTVLERATIRGNTAIGPWCKVNGEVSGVIFQGFANKAHDGFLGDSWVGEWVNLGAGTTNSNLLNTYGEVVARALPGGANERTGEQFLGAIIGDHVKTAICTRIMTGAVMHTGTMWAAGAPYSGTLPAFTWGTDESRRQFRASKFLEVAKSAMARRKIAPSRAYEARLAQLHAAATPCFNTDA